MEQQQQSEQQEMVVEEPGRTLAIAVDGSEHSDYAIDCPGVMQELMMKMKGEADSIREAYRKVLEQKRIDGEVEVAFGRVDEQIIAVATKHNACFIIIGSRGRGKWSRRIMGSVSSSVVHAAPVPVLVTHLPSKEGK